MEDYILISHLNDFIFCPRSIYFHNLYQSYSQKNYHRTPQVKGKAAHESIDQNKYSTHKKYITSLEVYSEKYNITGKIDIYDQKEQKLIERKRKIKKIYEGYKYQIYAQYFCLTEMGYSVKQLFFHSLVDNKRYPIPLPSSKEVKEFESLIQKMNEFTLESTFTPNINKCNQCIYRELCDYGG